VRINAGAALAPWQRLALPNRACVSDRWVAYLSALHVEHPFKLGVLPVAGFGVKFAVNLAPIKLRPNRIDVSFKRGAVSEFLHEPMIAEPVSHFVVAREPSEQILGVKFRRNFYERGGCQQIEQLAIGLNPFRFDSTYGISSTHQACCSLRLIVFVPHTRTFARKMPGAMLDDGHGSAVVNGGSIGYCDSVANWRGTKRGQLISLCGKMVLP